MPADCAASLLLRETGYLSTMVGLAWGDGLLALDDTIGSTVKDGGFEDAHNSKITWRHMLHQASEWTGTLFTKPDSVDHNRSVGGATAAAKGTKRELKEPGTFCKHAARRLTYAMRSRAPSRSTCYRESTCATDCSCAAWCGNVVWRRLVCRRVQRRAGEPPQSRGVAYAQQASPRRVEGSYYGPDRRIFLLDLER